MTVRGAFLSVFLALAMPALAQAPAPAPVPAPTPTAPAPRRPVPQPIPTPPPAPPPQPAAARPPLVAELSQSRVEITTGFSGAEVLVFGATERLLGEGGDDVLVVARSAVPEPLVVRRKTRVLGFWINGASARFRQVPGFYLLTGTRPLREMMEEERRTKQLGLDHLQMAAAGNQDEEFRSALLQLKQSAGLWHEEDEPLRISGARLFRARLPLPATVGTGDYRVEVMLVRDGRVLARQELGFTVDRVGTAARIADIADEQPVVYGLICILLAAFAGWLGSVLFRRG